LRPKGTGGTGQGTAGPLPARRTGTAAPSLTQSSPSRWPWPARSPTAPATSLTLPGRLSGGFRAGAGLRARGSPEAGA